MNLLESFAKSTRPMTTVGECYLVTKKPRDLRLSEKGHIQFAAMESIPHGGSYEALFSAKNVGAITSGTYFEKGDLLISKITPCFENGKQAFAHNLQAEFGYATTEVIPLKPRSIEHDPRLLFFYLLHPDIRGHIVERMEGSTGRQRVPENVLLNLIMPSFNRVDQVNIAGSLETVQAAIQKEYELAAAFKSLKLSAMQQLFTCGLRGEKQKETEIGLMPRSWQIAKLGSLGKVGNGTTPNRQNATYWHEGKLPWITSGRMYERRIESADVCVTEAALKECSLPRLHPGAVLIAIVGQGKTLGHCAILDIEATVSRHVGFIQPRRDVIHSGFLRGYLESQYDYLRQLASGNGSTRSALTCAILRDINLPVPPIEEQTEVVSILDSIDKKIELHQQKQSALKELFRSLLNKLMTGEVSVNELDVSSLPPGGLQPQAEAKVHS
jgi:type I restriction enzyme, S subunit